jgi:hypothetical protein
VEKVWLFGTLALTVARIDFLDPALVGEPDARERGVRLEVRPARSSRPGSVYASATSTLGPAVCRIDLLESRPGAADRMHWHPRMDDGEPGDRLFDVELSGDPLGWLTDRLTHLDELLELTTHPDASVEDVSAVRAAVADIVEETARGLEWARRPWPTVDRDERGLAVSG